MKRIHALDQSVINSIAAGEIINHPVNVVKELLENSIDAGSTSISVSILDGGFSAIKIEDNGCGISREDLPIACMRHTTSKLDKFEDITKICTFGFRGEALFSMTCAAKVSITTKTESDEWGSRADYLNGEILGNILQIAATTGTIVEVKELFYNNRIRLKQKPSNRSAEIKIADVMKKYAIVNPNIAFQLISNRKRVFETTGMNTTEKILKMMYNINSNEGCCKITKELRKNEYVNLWISTPGTRLPKPISAFFINGRLVSFNALKDRIQSKYGPERIAFLFVMLTIPLSDVDINVHPSKKTVKFINENEIIETISNQVAEDVAAKMNYINRTSFIGLSNKTQKKEINSKGQMSLEDILSKAKLKKAPIKENENFEIPPVANKKSKEELYDFLEQFNLATNHKQNNPNIIRVEDPPQISIAIAQTQDSPTINLENVDNQQPKTENNKIFASIPNFSKKNDIHASKQSKPLYTEKGQPKTEISLPIPDFAFTPVETTVLTPAPTPVRNQINEVPLIVSKPKNQKNNIVEPKNHKNVYEKHNPKSIFEELRFKPVKKDKTIEEIIIEQSKSIQDLLVPPTHKYVNLESINELKNEIAQNASGNFLSNSSFITVAGEKMLFKNDRKLIIVPMYDLLVQYFFQKIIFNFANFPKLRLINPVKFENGEILEQNSEMLMDYFSIEVKNNVLYALPMLASTATPLTDYIKFFLNQISLADFSNEKKCIQSISIEMASLYAASANQSTVGLIITDLLEKMIPQRNLSIYVRDL